jgi:YggT family protein
MDIILELVDTLLLVYSLLILARVLISWVRLDPYNPVVQFLYATTEPVLAPIRNLLPGEGMMLDFSPLIALLLISVLRRLI